MKLIKKYKNRRLYDTEISQYVTIEDLHRYVVEGLVFQVQDSESGNDLTNSTLLQIIVEMQAVKSPFLTTDILRQIICLANHPMHQSLQGMMEKLFATLEQPMQLNPLQQATEAWQKQVQTMMDQWQALFKK